MPTFIEREGKAAADIVGLWHHEDGTRFWPLADGTVRTDAEKGKGKVDPDRLGPACWHNRSDGYCYITFRIGRCQPYTPRTGP